MPRKNRGRFKANNNNRGPSNSNSVVIRNPFTNEGADVTETLRYLKEAFEGKVDADAIFTIFAACDFNVNETIEALFSVSNEASSHDDVQNSMIGSGSSATTDGFHESPEPTSTSAHLRKQYYTSTSGKHDNYQNYVDLNQRLFSLTLEESSVGNDPNINTSLNQSEVPYNGNSGETQYCENLSESLNAGTNIHYQNSICLLSSDAKNASDVSNQQLYNSWYPLPSCSYNVPSCSPTLRNAASSCSEKESKIFFPLLSPHSHFEADQNAAPVFYNHCQSLSSFNQSPPQFITPLVPSYQPKDINYAPFKNKGSATPAKKGKSTRSLKTDPPIENMIKQIIDKVIVNCKVLIILRGLPGSGKSTLALKLQQSGVKFSTDDFFYKRGKYHFKWAKLSEAHEWNRRRTKRAMEKGITPVIIDNTNVERWEIKPYIALGLQFKYDIHILEPDTPWKFNPDELAKRNRHKVSKEKIERMLERYERNVTVESLVDSAQDSVTGGSSGLEDISLCDGEQKDSELEICFMEKQEWFSGAQQTTADVSEKEFLGTVANQSNSILPGDNSVLLEAIVHREDETLSSYSGIYDSVDHSSSSCDISANEVCSNTSASSEIAATSGEVEEGSESGRNGSTEGLDEIQNCMCLKDLIILTEEGNEEFQTSSNQLSPSCSSHDSSNWEVVTNQEDDFTWTSNPQVNFQEVMEPDITFSVDNDITNKSNLEAVKEEDSCKNQICSKTDKVYSLIEDESGITMESTQHVDTCEWDVETDCSFGPRPQRETPSLPQRKTCLSTYPNNSNYCLFKKKHTRNEWGSIVEEEENGSWNDDDNTEPKLEKPLTSILPKPQRSLTPNVGISASEVYLFHKNLKRGESPQSVLLETVPETEELSEETKPSVDFGMLSPCMGRKRKHDSLLCNLSPGSTGGVEWEFPNFLSDPPCLPAVAETSPKISTACSTTQTDPQDFILLYESSHIDAHNKDFKILRPSSLDEQLSKHLTMPFTKECSNVSVPKFARFDKSTSTSDISESLETHEKLCVLQDCFPDIQYEDLKAHLEIFQGDTEWLTNTLLDWGYKYNAGVRCGVSVRSECELEETCVPQTGAAKQNSNLSVLHEKSSMVPVLVSENDNCRVLSGRDDIKDDLLTDGHVFDVSVADAENFTGCDLTHNAMNYNNTFSSEECAIKQDSPSPSSASEPLQLRLDPAFALQLEQYFGPVHHGAPSSCSHIVEIDEDLAKEIYKRWCETIQKSTALKTEVFNEAVDDGNRKHDMCNISEANSDNFSKRVRERQPEAGEISFAEIMDHEYALHISEKERLKSQKRKNSVGTRLKKDKLYRTFPGIDRSALDAVFEANKNTLIALEADVGKTPSMSNEVDCDLLGLSSEGSSTVVSGPESIVQDFATENWNDWVDPSERAGESSSTGLDSFSVDAVGLREEAGHHHSLHRQYMESAQKAFHDGKKQVASYYRQKSHYHLEKFKEINKEAVEIIVEENRLKHSNPLVLDLHGLYVPEAIHVLEKFIKSKRTEYFNSTETDVLNISVITGHGSRSVNGPKLRSSVAEYLKSKGFWFEFVNSGMFNIIAGQK